ncbi:C40 family peptidase [Hymenobacter sp. H14-R3]|uniref:C40 family peptidase n=1 Tax=Hymenobacter sp. H14-R3 TaxID=3046308 RepID=UPI0024BB18F0|nr:C40 family peptidase [Hymenobacter sp. H14-R3]MDJ0364298.1 C40 family peptidase [Hymenobacter sp. H14-R3]
MKNTLLCCLAAASLALSFCFEKMPDASASAGVSAPAVAEASLLSGLLEAGTPPAAVEPPATTASRDSLAYGYYNQTLGLKLAQTENKSLLQTVTDWLGTPYSYGAASRRGTDCSGFVSQVFKKVYGITLKRSSRSMFTTVQRVAKTDMKAGDLVFFSHGKGNIYHVGIYLKDNKFAHSACNGGVMVSSLNQAYYHRNFYAAGRVAGTEALSADATAAETAELLTAAASARPE